MWEYIPVVLPSAIAFCFNLSLTVGSYGWEEELREQNKIEIMLIIPRKWITRKILAAGITEVCIECNSGKEERRPIEHLEIWLKPPLAHVPHTHEVAWPFLG